jgi:NhaA family Na+:H+ antiporter
MTLLHAQAIFYPDPETPFEPWWLVLIIAAMGVAYGMRRCNVLDWRMYVAVPGSMAWYGMLRSALHPALALMFVVPFMPTGDKTDSSSPNGTSTDGPDKSGYDDSANYLEHGDDVDPNEPAPQTNGNREQEPAKAPLFEFQHACRSFTDLFVLFLFGITNAGVDTSNGVGPFAWVVVLALIIGKFIGIGLAAVCLSKCGFPLPKGMGYSHVLMVSFIAGCGLTVSLFMAGEAFEDPEVQDQGKLGALLSVATAVLAIALSKVVDFRSLETSAYGARFLTEIYTRGCHWIPRMFA